jgi:hypothetical protein
VLVQTLPFAVLVFPNPPVEVTAIVVMDGVSKDTMELSIRSCEALQEWVVGPKLILCPWHAGSVGARTIGGGVVTHTIDGIPWGYRHPRICAAHGCGHCRLLQLRRHRFLRRTSINILKVGSRLSSSHCSRHC